ncbi:phage portal protein [Aureimonas altamirensis]|uniref:phage portal protein n=1 Tax=Aureimonas altamirensis TaxID=370622 RepID=UPI001E491FC2|nr:phage portal protein [Aureimonas altamirensis]UHD44919.1 phage portal protein [Aureimonas altamirensis]
MRLGPFQISRAPVGQKALAAVPQRGWTRILEAFPGAWQKNVEVNRDAVLAHHADFGCRTLIASDIAKLGLRLVLKDEHGVWKPVTNPAYSPVLRKPNHFQNRIQFIESWVLSKLQSGNTYVLKQRDNRGVVVKLYILDPNLVRPLIANDGSVFYHLSQDELSGLPSSIIVPAREIIHDRFNCLFHPLVGISPIFASGLAATQGLSIQNNATRFFQNGAQPGGILTAPGEISDKTAVRLKTHWDTNFTGENAGKVAVVGDGLKYEAMTQKAVDAQLIEQLKWSAEVVCSVYRVPPYKIGVGQQPAYNNVESLNLGYYSSCLQVLIEAIEACLDEGLGMDGHTIGAEFDLDDLLRMDTATQFDVAQKAKGVATLDEQRRRLNLPPVEGGDTIYLQQQDHSLAAIAARDEQLIEAGKSVPEPDPANDNMDAEAADAMAEIARGFAE